MPLYPIKYQDSVDLEGDNDDIITLLTPPEQRMLQSILNNVESNPEIFIEDYLTQDTDVVDEFLAILMAKLMGEPVISSWLLGRIVLDPGNRDFNTGAVTWGSVPTENYAGSFVLAGAINNEIAWHNVALRKGTYEVSIHGRKLTTSGIATIKVNSIIECTFDRYANPAVGNDVAVQGSVVIPADIVTTVGLHMLSKNALSSNYGISFNWLAFQRTGD